MDFYKNATTAKLKFKKRKLFFCGDNHSMKLYECCVLSFYLNKSNKKEN